MLKYYAVKFERYVPSVAGLTIHGSVEHYTLISLESIVDESILDGLPHVELTADEVNIGRLFYGTGREYRKAYSDHEGLVPDADELAKGKRKTKVYMEDSDKDATVSLMKKIARRLVIDEFDTRTDRTGEAALLEELVRLGSIDEINLYKEEKFGFEIPWPQARKLGLIDESGEHPRRINPPTYGVKF
jgi:hypothetical protein